MGVVIYTDTESRYVLYDVVVQANICLYGSVQLVEHAYCPYSAVIFVPLVQSLDAHDIFCKSFFSN